MVISNSFLNIKLRKRRRKKYKKEGMKKREEKGSHIHCS
jgi:hypothetical protein